MLKGGSIIYCVFERNVNVLKLSPCDLTSVSDDDVPPYNPLSRLYLRIFVSCRLCLFEHAAFTSMSPALSKKSLVVSDPFWVLSLIFTALVIYKLL